MRSPIFSAILRTLAYADVSGYPLTTLEVWQRLWIDGEPISVSLSDVDHVLRELRQAGDIAHDRGMWMLAGDTAAVDRRITRQIIAKRKFTRAKRYVKLLSFVPFIRGIAVVNTLALDDAGEESDIDLLILVRPGRLWLTRLFVAGVLQFLRVRPRAGHTRDAICASFFLATDQLDLQSVALPDDVYLYHWIASVYPLWEAGGDGRSFPLFGSFRQANAWVKQRMPYAPEVISHPMRVVPDRHWQRAKRRFFELVYAGHLGDFLDRRVERWQRWIMPVDMRDRAASADTGVVLDDRMLKLHVTDRRAEIREQWRAIMTRYEL